MTRAALVPASLSTSGCSLSLRCAATPPGSAGSPLTPSWAGWATSALESRWALSSRGEGEAPVGPPSRYWECRQYSATALKEVHSQETRSPGRYGSESHTKQHEQGGCCGLQVHGFVKSVFGTSKVIHALSEYLNPAAEANIKFKMSPYLLLILL